ncbi:hypothetical protein OHJ21_21205 [Virgibacillus sp. LDC1]|uniref:hypothetical protein n=1 Tax=Paenibacillus sp. GM2FR TaxID=2059268 RepID=UPI001054EEE3|nr:hypothetical protein [Paenibacillus sp. GM2FR]MCV4233683.1 hypothetical protein [Virgibacillus sp. LDC1]
MKRSPPLYRWGSSYVYLRVAAGKLSLLMDSAASSGWMLLSLKFDPFSRPCGHGIRYLPILDPFFEPMRTLDPLFADIRSFF